MTEQTLRKDAARNRERLIAAGRDLFAQRGLDATLNDVAHHAGVGVGTAYRRFTNKEELIEAIWRQQVDELEAILHEALATPDPWDGLVLYLEHSLAVQARDRGMAQLLSGRRIRQERHDWQRDRLAPLVNQVADRAREAGVLRGDVTGTDLIFLQIALTAISGTVQDGAVPDGRSDAGELYRRYLWIVLDGLRASASGHSVLPLAALTTLETHTLLQPRTHD
jgi:AcrR family transcriptional regulator